MASYDILGNIAIINGEGKSNSEKLIEAKKLRAVYIYLDKNDFAKLKGYKGMEIRGGDLYGK